MVYEVKYNQNGSFINVQDVSLININNTDRYIRNRLKENGYIYVGEKSYLIDILYKNISSDLIYKFLLEKLDMYWRMKREDEMLNSIRYVL